MSKGNLGKNWDYNSVNVKEELTFDDSLTLESGAIQYKPIQTSYDKRQV